MKHYSPGEASEWEGVEPLPQMEPLEIYHTRLKRSMMWDMVGPRIAADPERFGQAPASNDVLEKEFNEMVVRQQGLLPLGLSLDIACRTASEAATAASLAMRSETDNLTEEEKAKTYADNFFISEAVAKSVLAHFISSGVLKVGVPV